MKDRKEGYYWIKLSGTWIIGNWEPIMNLWFIPCNEVGFTDQEVEEVEERQQLPPTERYRRTDSIDNRGLILYKKVGERVMTMPVQVNKADRLMLPNGIEFSFSYNPVREALEVIKQDADGDRSISIWPAVSNHIYIK